MGKTRLAARFAAEAHAGGAAVLHGRIDEETVVPVTSRSSKRSATT